MHKFPTLIGVCHWTFLQSFDNCLKPILLLHLKLDDVLNLVAGQVQLDAVINLQAQDDDIQCRTDMAQLPDSNL